MRQTALAAIGQLRWALTHLPRIRQIARDLRCAMGRYDWTTMARIYDETMGSVGRHIG